MSAAGGGQQQGQDNTYYILWVLALIALIGGLIWFFLQDFLKIAFLKIKTFELLAIYYSLSSLPTDLPIIGTFVAKSLVIATADLEVAKQITYDTLNTDIATLLATESGEFLRYPMALYFIFLAIVIYKSNVYLRLRKKFNMKTLAQQEQKNWPQIRIVTKLDLVNEDIYSGPWAIGMTPMLFAQRNKLLIVDYADNSNVIGPKNLAPEFKASLDKTRTELVFSMQLGKAWQGIENMAPHRRAVFAILAARGCRDTRTAHQLVAQLCNSAAQGKLDCEGADALWQKHQNNRQIQEIIQQHGYEMTVMISMLMFAREDGVLASSDFLWVKPLDRRFWYVLNGTGRQTPLAEVAGIFSHWFNESALKKALSVPMVAQAVEALQIALEDVVYQPNEKEREEIAKRHHLQVSGVASSEEIEVETHS